MSAKKPRARKPHVGRVFVFTSKDSKSQTTDIVGLIKQCGMSVNEIKTDGRVNSPFFFQTHFLSSPSRII